MKFFLLSVALMTTLIAMSASAGSDVLSLKPDQLREMQLERISPWPAEVDAYALVTGFADLVGKAELPAHAVRELFADVAAAGAMHVKELIVADWQSFPSWGKLRPLEARRFLRAAAA